MGNATENFTDERTGIAPEKRDLLDKLLLEEGGEFNTFPLSFAQQRLWFLDQLEPNSPLYNETAAIRLRGRLDADVLRRSFNEVIRRHEALRTVFAAVDGQPVQVVLPRVSLPLPLVDLEPVPSGAREAEVARHATVEARKPFDLARGPLVRSTLLRLGSEEHVLLLVMHHIISDGWSGGVMFREMGALYEAFRAGRPSPLGELEIQYADYAYWQRDWLRDEAIDEQLAYWKKQLAGKLPVLELPVAAPRPVIESYGGARIAFMLPTPVRDALKRLGQSEGATLFMTLLAAFKTLLHRYTTETDLLIGTPVAGRTRSETEELIGFFANTLVLRTNLAGDPTFRELLRRVREVTLEAYAHQELPFEKLVEELQPERALGRNPIFQAMFVLQNAPMPVVELPDFSMELREIESGTAKFDLLLMMAEDERGLRGTFEYNTDLFNAATIERLVGHFRTLLEGVAADPDRSLSLLPLLTEAEWQRQIFEWNATGSDAPLDECVHSLFEAQAARTPEAIALSFGDTLLTYQELNRLSNQLAHYLRRLGVGPEMIVGICMERSWEMVVALLGVVKAGGAGVALDLTYPRDRLRFMIRDAHMPVLLTQTRVAEMFKDESDFPVMVRLDEGFDVMHGESADDLESGVTVNNLLYVIYTSGSTGLPKGIGMSHRAFLNLLRWQQRHPLLSQQSKILQFATFGFCVSFQEIFTALCSGGTLVMPSEELRKDVEGLACFIEEQHIERLHLPFAALKHLAEASSAGRGRLPSSLREVVTAGEQLQVTAAVKKLFGSLDNCSLHNQYGASETHVVCDLTLAGMSGEWPELPPIGRPIANTQIYLLNRSWQPVPVGVPGELYVGGASLARCYVNDAALTAERFIPDPFCREPGARLYRTGDLARHLPDGRIEYLGRADLQVKIRGYRVELGEVETTLAKHDAVRDVAVVAHAEDDGSKRLTAYVVFDETHPTANELRAFLKRELPEYMVPTAFVSMSALPLNANGKLDQQALPSPKQTSGAQEASAPPRNQIEDLLAGIWSDVLRLERVGINDNFFELGGHSLLATQVMSRVRAVFGVELPLRTLFEKPVMADLAEIIARTKSGQESVRAATILPAAVASEFTPLSFSQHRIWLYSQFDSQSAVNNIPTVLRINGALDPQLLERALNEIANRHESLRTTFAVHGDQPVQTVVPSLPITLAVADHGTLSPEVGDEELERIALDLSRQPFDLARGPLWRAELRRLRDEEHVLFLIMHHIISDGWSIRLIVRELASLYEAFAAGRPSSLPELTIQYPDWVAWQREWLQGEALEGQLSYWRRQLEGAPTVLELPTDRPRADAPDLRGEVQSFLLPKDFAGALKALSRQENVTLFMTLMAAFQLLLARYTGQEDILVGTPVAGRTRAETEELVGCFINTLVLRARLSHGMTVRELLRETRETSIGAFAHQDLPFEKLLEELSPPRDLTRHPLFQFMFVLHTTAPQEEGAFAELTYRLVPAHNGTMPFDLILAVAERGEGLHVAFGYHRGLFDVATVKRMAAHFEALLKTMVDDPRQRLAALPLISEQEQRQLNAWNETQVDYPRTQCIQQLFERQAELTPDAVALSFDGQELNYAELNRRANQLAHYLRRLGVGPEVPVALFVERSVEMIVGLLAVLKAGGAYVPLDIASPLPRLTHLLDTLGAPVLLTQDRLAGNLPSVWAQIISLDTDWELIESESGDNPPQANTPDNLAYVIYTSGSTGGPKGVSVTHRGVVRLVKGTNYVNFGDDEVFLQASPVYFDASTFEIWGALLNGAQLVIAPPHHLVVEDFRRIIEQHRVTTLWLTAGLFHQLAGEHIEVLKPVRQLLAGGDVLSAPHVRRTLEVNSPARLVNGYGPTEGTTFTCCHVMTDAAGVGLNVPIGRPVANTQVFLLDSQLRPVPIGVTGELYIGGDGLARGYFNEPALTAEKFIPHPLGAQPGARLYRSGDQARYLPDGRIEFLGRIDHQVKIRGFRVELGEIEATLGEHPAVRQCVAIAWEEADDKRLAAYAAVHRGAAPSGDELRGYLKEKLPAYMVPGTLIVLDELPLTPNGKVDRRALPPPGANRHMSLDSFVAPRDAVEHRLAEIWRGLLNVETVGVFDDFFELGGHSLLATQLIARVRDSFEAELTFNAVFEHSRLAEMACVIKDEVMKQLEGMSEEEARQSLQPPD